jgi:DNA-directed RNA polymerase specialized sigma24 family protein
MNMSTPQTESGSANRAAFPTTHWSVVLAAGGKRSPKGDAALETLAKAYWYPIYAFLRRQGYASVEAQDLTQAFFARLLEKNYPAQADREKGRFRSFLLLTLRHFLADERQHAAAVKRGGGCTVLSLDEEASEGRYRAEPADLDTPETLFERRWADTILARAKTRLAEEYSASGKAAIYQVLQAFQPGELRSLSYSQAAQHLATSESAVKALIHRMRKRHQQLVRDEIAQTVADAGDVDDELRHLIAVLSR